jgi:hypothetical protein
LVDTDDQLPTLAELGLTKDESSKKDSLEIPKPSAFSFKTGEDALDCCFLRTSAVARSSARASRGSALRAAMQRHSTVMVGIEMRSFAGRKNTVNRSYRLG